MQFEDVNQAVVLEQYLGPNRGSSVTKKVLEVSLNNVNVSNSVVALQEINSLYVERTTYRIRNCAFTNVANAIKLHTYGGIKKELQVDNCIFDKNNISIQVRASDLSEINIRNSEFIGGLPRWQDADCQVKLDLANSSFSITNNRFEANKNHILCLEVNQPDDVCSVSRNTFRRNTNGAGILLSFRSMKDMEIQGNRFIENRNLGSTSCIVMNPSLAPTENSLDVRNNCFIRNHGRYIMNLVKHHFQTVEPHVKVHTNGFDNNVATTATINAGIVSCSITDNNFQNPTTKTEVLTGLNRREEGTEINCQNNFWNTISEDEVQSRIWDGNDEQKRNLVKFVPFLKGANSAALCN